MLSGMVVCGRCGHRLQSKTKAKRRFVCVRDRGGCGGIMIIADPLESHVAATVLNALNAADWLEEASQQDTASQRAMLIGQLRPTATPSMHSRAITTWTA